MIRVTDPAGNVVLDGEKPVYHLLQPVNLVSGSITNIDVNSYLPPIIGLSSGSMLIIKRQVVNAHTYRFSVRSLADNTVIHTMASVSDTLTGNYGIRIRNNTGLTIIDSASIIPKYTGSGFIDTNGRSALNGNIQSPQVIDNNDIKLYANNADGSPDRLISSIRITPMTVVFPMGYFLRSVIANQSHWEALIYYYAPAVIDNYIGGLYATGTPDIEYTGSSEVYAEMHLNYITMQI